MIHKAETNQTNGIPKCDHKQRNKFREFGFIGILKANETIYENLNYLCESCHIILRLLIHYKQF